MTTNKEVLLQAGVKRILLQNIRKRQLQFLGHVLQEKKLEHLSIAGKIPGKRARGRQRNTFLQQFPATAIEIIHNANECDNWKQFSDKVINV